MSVGYKNSDSDVVPENCINITEDVCMPMIHMMTLYQAI